MAKPNPTGSQPFAPSPKIWLQIPHPENVQINYHGLISHIPSEIESPFLNYDYRPISLTLQIYRVQTFQLKRTGFNIDTYQLSFTFGLTKYCLFDYHRS